MKGEGREHTGGRAQSEAEGQKVGCWHTAWAQSMGFGEKGRAQFGVHAAHRFAPRKTFSRPGAGRARERERERAVPDGASSGRSWPIATGGYVGRVRLRQAGELSWRRLLESEAGGISSRLCDATGPNSVERRSRGDAMQCNARDVV